MDVVAKQITVTKITALFVVLMSARLSGAQPSPQTLQAFDAYVAQAEARIAHKRGSKTMFLSLDLLSAEKRSEIVNRLKSGEIVIERQGNDRPGNGKQEDAPAETPGGLIHDWSGVVFIPGATIGQVLAVVQDYDHMTRYYAPDVMQSRLISRSGDDMRVFMRMRKHKVITVVLDTEYDVHYGRIDAAHQFSSSRSTRVTEVADADAGSERAAGQDHGFMWKLNSYWAFEQADGGVYVECEAISLTRDIPAGLGWLIGPFVNSIPRESLEFTLSRTKAALRSEAGPNPEIVQAK
jgi:hypothetical protein